MKIVMVSCILNIHQAGVADELYRITDGNYWFIQTEMPTDEDKKGGDRDFSGRPYLVLAASGRKTTCLCYATDKRGRCDAF